MYSDTVEMTNDKGNTQIFKFSSLREPETLKIEKVDLLNAYIHGYLREKSRRWTEYVKVLWGGS